MLKHKNIYRIIPLAALALLAFACRDDYAVDEPYGDGGSAIRFGASIVEERGVSTRADDPGVIDSMYVASDPWSQDFYIQLNTTDANGDDEVMYGVYGVPSAQEGRLESRNPDEALNWQTLDRPHTFYSWTLPWMETGTYTPSAEPLAVPFYNSSEINGFNKNRNNAVYEHFIGAKSGSFAYNEHGKYVELTFHHLVSKIKVESLILIQPDGSVQKDLQADMTFVGLPIEATFYPHPEPGDASGAPANWRPYVGSPYVESPDTGVTYYINNRANTQDLFYICPEVNFKNIDFQIKINTEGYEKLQTYYGTFDDVVFEREPGWGYDRPFDQEGNPEDSKILHAGEMMRLHIVLIPGKGPGLKVIIQKWSTDKPVESQYHSHQGFYTDAELQEMMDILYGINAETYDNPPPELEMLFEMYGYTEDGKKYFPLYDNLTPKKGNSTSNIFPIPPGYIIDGMGHTVTLKTNWGSYWSGEPASNYFNIGGICRDIYFSDENGNNTIYIDPQGFIWVTDQNTGELVRTQNQLPEELPEDYKGMDISCTTGSIRYSKYYNDNITG